MCVWSTLCVLRVVLFTIFSRDLVSHILPSQTLNLGPQKHQRFVVQNSQFSALNHVSFSFGICLFSQPLTCWWSLSNMDNKTTDCALLSIQEWFDPRDFRQDACQRVCVCVCVCAFYCVEVFYEQPPTALVIWDVLLQGSCSFVGHSLCNTKSLKWNIMLKMEPHRYLETKTM